MALKVIEWARKKWIVFLRDGGHGPDKEDRKRISHYHELGDEATEKYMSAEHCDDPLMKILLIVSPEFATKALYGGVRLSKTNVCLMAHLIFNYLKEGNDAQKLLRIIIELDRQEVISRLHQFPWDCQSLGHMVEAVIRCCKLYEAKEKLENVSEEILRQLCTRSIWMFDDVLLPLCKRKNYLTVELEVINSIESVNKRRKAILALEKGRRKHSQASSRASRMTEQVLNSFTEILRDYGKMWPKEVGKPLQVFCANVPRIIIEGELRQGNLGQVLIGFANQIPYAIRAFSKCKAEEWRRGLEPLWQERRPSKSRLCEIWQLLLGVSREAAFEFLGSLLANTVEAMLNSRAQDERLFREDYADIAEEIAGALNYLFIQCVQVSTNDEGTWAHLADQQLWESYVGSEISKILGRIGERLQDECWPMYDYLANKMVRVIAGKVDDANRGEFDMAIEKESGWVENFLWHLAKGGTKILPVVGGILEEAIFGTMEADEAGEEGNKLAMALADLEEKVEGQTFVLADVLSKLKSETDFHEDVARMLDELIDYYRSGEEKGEVPTLIKEGVENLFTRYNEKVDRIFEGTIEQLNESIDRLNEAISGVRLGENAGESGGGKVITRVAMIRGLNRAHKDDLDQLILSFPEAGQYVSDGNKKRRVIDVVRWAESPGKPGLEALYMRAIELGIKL